MKSMKIIKYMSNWVVDRGGGGGGFKRGPGEFHHVGFECCFFVYNFIYVMDYTSNA